MVQIPIKVDIISGFLGAGKTTLIAKLLKESLHHVRVGIIENEFGEIGIDGSILNNSSIELTEINSGCICCTVSGDFQAALENILHKFTLERIIIEPSGVGKLSEVLKAVTAPGLQDDVAVNMIITVVDVLKYQLYLRNFNEFYQNQIENAKTIILSRTQKIDENKLQSIINSIRQLNINANIITTPWDSLNAELIISLAEGNASLTLEHQLKKQATLHQIVIHPESCQCGCHHDHTHKLTADETFAVWGIETAYKYDKHELDTILQLLNKNSCYGTVLRGKGILETKQGNWVQFDFVPGETEVKNAKADYTGRICIIGSDLNKAELNKLFSVSE
jgi:G3E family GTPase